MKYAIIYELVCKLYATVLRPLLVEAVNDPDKEWDDIVLRMVDGVFNFNG